MTWNVLMEILWQILLFVFLGYSLTKCFAWACVIKRMRTGNMAVNRLHWVANISLVVHEMFSLAPLNLFGRLFSSFGAITCLSFPPLSLYFELSYYHLWSIASLFCFLLRFLQASETDKTQIGFIGNGFMGHIFVLSSLFRVPITIDTKDVPMN